MTAGGLLRSTKGASKQRRDLINAEISNMRDMLPIPESSRQRLSQLQIMSLACCYIRKCNYFERLFRDPAYENRSPFEFSQAMTGFLLITTREGKLLYISENVTEYLGHSMVDMLTQGDSLYDIIDKRDHSSVQTQLLQTAFNPSPDSGLDSRTFFCRMNVSRSFRRQAGFGDHKVMHVKGHFIQPSIRDHYGNQPVFMAICSPLITPDVKESITQNSTLLFQSVHGLDMKYIEMASNAEYHLGYDDNEIYGKSWYELLHPEDIAEAKEKHMQLIKSSHEMGCMLTVRLAAKDGSWVWVNMVMHIRQPFICDNGDPAIVCINQIISDAEASHFKLQSQLYSSHIARSPEFLNPTHGSSPPHTITQESVDRDNVNLPFTALLQNDDLGVYHTEFGVSIASAPGVGSEGSPIRGSASSSTPVHTMQQRSTNSGSDSGSEGTGSPKSSQEHKQILRADILNRLKRKMTEISNQQCKASKIPKVTTQQHGGHNNSAGQYTISGTAIITRANGEGGDFLSASLGSNTVQVMQPSVLPGQYNADLSVKKEVLIPEPVMLHSQLNEPPTPSESVSSEPAEKTSLSVDVSDTVLVPLSLLTPDSTPSSSPVLREPLMLSSPGTEQQVPTVFTDIEEAVQRQELENESLIKKPHVKKQSRDSDFCLNLPELDLESIESYFAEVANPSKVKLEDLVVKTEPLSPPQSVIGSVSPAHSPMSQSDITVGSPYSYHSPSPYACSVASPASTTESSYSSSETAEPALPSLSACQLNNLVATVTEAILDMVKQNSTTPTVDATSTPSISGEFMIVNGRDTLNPTDSLSVEVPNMETDDTTQPDPLAQVSLIEELHQLDELASNASPSYGEASMSTLFEETM